MFRRLRNQAMKPDPLDPGQLQLLTQANQLVAGGQPAQAAPLFARLAGVMETSNHQRRAANLHAQAAHAYADSQAEQSALAHARSAMSLFVQYQMVRRTPVFYANITRKLNAHGMQAAAQVLAKEFGAQVGALPASAPAGSQAHGNLPTNCPKCGAPLHSSEASWVDAVTAECDYCGAMIRAE
jgi:hypothetical protein